MQSNEDATRDTQIRFTDISAMMDLVELTVLSDRYDAVNAEDRDAR